MIQRLPAWGTTLGKRIAADPHPGPLPDDLLRLLSGKDIVKALGKAGWELERVTGSHHVMRHADGRHVSVPVHGA
ncbi:MAG: type II toxin-antitoxin system HicA family toxin, partial [Streptosporangiaceae bacterium]